MTAHWILAIDSISWNHFFLIFKQLKFLLNFPGILWFDIDCGALPLCTEMDRFEYDQAVCGQEEKKTTFEMKNISKSILYILYAAYMLGRG